MNLEAQALQQDSELYQIFGKAFKKREFFKFVFPSMITMLFVSLYSIVDGIFVSNYVGSNALASLNLVYPLINVVFAVGIMLSVGGCAITSIRLGEGAKERADKTFSLVVVTGFLLSLILMVIALFNLDHIVRFLGADEELWQDGMYYAGILTLFMPFIILKIILENFVRTDGRADISLYISVAGGLLNIFLDYLFIAVFQWGIAGAAIATGLGFVFSLLLAIGYFLSKKSVLKFRKPKIKPRVILNVFINGSSQMVNELSCLLYTSIWKH